MPVQVQFQAPRPCPRCGRGKLLYHSHLCGYCYQRVALGAGPQGILEDPPLTGKVTVQQMADFHLGAGLAVGLGAVALGAGASAAAGVIIASGLTPTALAGAALAFLGGGGITFGGLTSLCLWHLRNRRPFSVLGLTDALLGLPWRRLGTVWRQVCHLRETDPPDPLVAEEEEWLYR